MARALGQPRGPSRSLQREDVIRLLRDHGIAPSAQRVALGAYVLDTVEHPSADQVFARVRRRFPAISRATVYNTLNLFVKHRLLRELVLSEGRIVFDPNMAPHHHFVDDETGTISDIAWDALDVRHVEALPFDVREYQVVVRGRTGTPDDSEPSTS